MGEEEQFKGELTLVEYIEWFKRILIKRYNWSVSDAHNYNNEDLVKYHSERLEPHYAYFKIFNVERDLYSN